MKIKHSLNVDGNCKGSFRKCISIVHQHILSSLKIIIAVKNKVYQTEITEDEK